MGDLPAGPGNRVSEQPPRDVSPTCAGQPHSVPRPWLAIAPAVTAAVAIAALVVALTRPIASHPLATIATTSTYTPAETAAAQQQLCDTYKLAAHSAQVETAGSDKAMARIATTDGAILLEFGAANPAVDSGHRDAARALALAYGTLTAKASYGIATDTQYQAALDDAIAKDAAMKQVCGGN